MVVPLTVEFGVGDLAGTRFAVSPAHEAITALQLLAVPSRQPVHAPWCRWAQRRLATRPLRAPLLHQLVVHDRPSWPEFLAPAPRPGAGGIEDQLAVLRTTAPRHVLASLRRAFGDDPPAAARELAARPAQVLTELVGELREVHDRLIEPHWPRMRALLEVDIAHRARMLARDGPAALFGHLHPAVSWRDGVLTIDQGHRTSRIQLGPGGLVLAPGVFGGPRAVIKGATSSQTTLRYPARGIGDLWTATGTVPPDALVRLLGAARARVLNALISPATATLLAREQGVTASAISQHLAVLHANGLVERHRSGREVHYSANDTGRALLQHQLPPSAAVQGRRAASRGTV